MLGDAGLSEINTLVLQSARMKGFLDVRGLCSDTTAQEARIPYPNEVGLMRAFADSVRSGFKRLGGTGRGAIRKVTEIVTKIKTQVRHHRLFSKTKEERLKVATKLSRLSKTLLSQLSQAIRPMQAQDPSMWSGEQKKSFHRLAMLQEVMKKLLPQINYYIRTGFVARDKIVSLFTPECRAILRGKVGKDIEFGIKWGINQMRGGYISLFELPKMLSTDADYALESIIHNQELFGASPHEFGFDRGGWSEEHLKGIKDQGVKRVAVAPRGSADWLVSKSCQERMVRERAQVEGKIGTIKHYGFNKPNAKNVSGMRRCAHRSELRFNMTRLLKDMARQAVPA